MASFECWANRGVLLSRASTIRASSWKRTQERRHYRQLLRARFLLNDCRPSVGSRKGEHVTSARRVYIKKSKCRSRAARFPSRAHARVCSITTSASGRLGEIEFKDVPVAHISKPPTNLTDDSYALCWRFAHGRPDEVNCHVALVILYCASRVRRPLTLFRPLATMY